MQSKADMIGYQILIDFEELFSHFRKLAKMFPDPIMFPLRLSDAEGLMKLLEETAIKLS